jgi:response regulator RpfG family c-di-GMP phosphodiesterase
MRSHAELGAEALSEAGMNVQVVDAVRAHHERWDGGGLSAGASGRADPAGGAHPARLRGLGRHAQAPGVGRTDHRRWALEEIQTCAGSQFDPEVARAAVDCFAADAS